MNIYNITVYHNKSGRSVRLEGWPFDDKDLARDCGAAVAFELFGPGPYERGETSIYVDWVKEA